jgi:hypothetical protein
MLHFFGQGQSPHEVGEVVGQCMKLEPNLVVAELGQVIDEPNLYLKFGSDCPRPSTILEYANRFGLLRYSQSTLKVRTVDAARIRSAFNWGRGELDSETLPLQAEKATDWLVAFGRASTNLRIWSELQESGDYVEMSDFLEMGFNYAMGSSLTYQVSMDPATGLIESDIIAASLADLIEVQWGTSIAANMLHRQCAECPNWFSIYPGSGRPEKQFCSDACRMRAYRERKKTKAQRLP